MAVRYPHAHPLANSAARFSLVVQGTGGLKIYQLSPFWTVTVAVGIAVLATWYLVATLYFVFRDDVMLSLVANQNRAQFAYEDRLATLRARLDRLSTHQILNQDTLEGQLGELVTRQAQLESRQALVAAIGENVARLPHGAAAAAKAGQKGLAGVSPPEAISVGTGGPEERLGASQTGALGFAPEARRQRPHPLPPVPVARPAPAPMPDTAPPPLRRDSLSATEDMRKKIEAIASRSRLIELRQMRMVRAYEAAAKDAGAQARRIIAATGLNPDSLAPKAASDIGGPLIPLSSENGAFGQAVAAAQLAIAEAERFGRVRQALPVEKPLWQDHEITSGFGPRLDPFTRGLAMHAGLDFRAPTGTNVVATAPGRVIEAGYRGGYGKMVEIEHAYGITTRYGHLSAILVSEGDKVIAGTPIGQVGSTGRSTGPHLHYEVRIDDEAHDPLRFVRAKER